MPLALVCPSQASAFTGGFTTLGHDSTSAAFSASARLRITSVRGAASPLIRAWSANRTLSMSRSTPSWSPSGSRKRSSSWSRWSESDQTAPSVHGTSTARSGPSRGSRRRSASTSGIPASGDCATSTHALVRAPKWRRFAATPKTRTPRAARILAVCSPVMLSSPTTTAAGPAPAEPRRRSSVLIRLLRLDRLGRVYEVEDVVHRRDRRVCRCGLTLLVEDLECLLHRLDRGPHRLVGQDDHREALLVQLVGGVVGEECGDGDQRLVDTGGVPRVEELRDLGERLVLAVDEDRVGTRVGVRRGTFHRGVHAVPGDERL